MDVYGGAGARVWVDGLRGYRDDPVDVPEGLLGGLVQLHLVAVMGQQGAGGGLEGGGTFLPGQRVGMDRGRGMPFA